jgi:hypothetical protein
MGFGKQRAVWMLTLPMAMPDASSNVKWAGFGYKYSAFTNTYSAMVPLSGRPNILNSFD